jgi:hypothetical protein
VHAGSLLLLSLIVAAEPPAAKPPELTLETVTVEPASPAANTLCRLRVTLKNAGKDYASALEVTVRLDGQELPAYQNRLFYDPVPPGATREVRLFNFWSSEAGRPAPPDGKLAVEVTLRSASWMSREVKGGAEVWTPLAAVDGLPASKSIVLRLAKAPR